MSDATEDDDDNPELTDTDFARARPFPEMFPELARKLKAQGGRPRLERPKVHVGFRLAADVVEGIKATGKGYNARVERVLRDALAGGNCDGDACTYLEPSFEHAVLEFPAPEFRRIGSRLMRVVSTAMCPFTCPATGQNAIFAVQSGG